MVAHYSRKGRARVVNSADREGGTDAFILVLLWFRPQMLLVRYSSKEGCVLFKLGSERCAGATPPPLPPVPASFLNAAMFPRSARKDISWWMLKFERCKPFAVHYVCLSVAEHYVCVLLIDIIAHT